MWMCEIDIFIPVRKTFIMSITHIYNIGIPKHKKHDFFVQVRNFLLPLSLKVFRHYERDTHSFYAEFSICPPPSHATPAARPSAWLRRAPRVNRLLARQNSTNWLFSNLSPCFRCVTSLTSLVTSTLWDFYCDISEWHVRFARAWTPALMFAPN